MPGGKLPPHSLRILAALGRDVARSMARASYIRVCGAGAGGSRTIAASEDQPRTEKTVMRVL